MFYDFPCLPIQSFFFKNSKKYASANRVNIDMNYLLILSYLMDLLEELRSISYFIIR